MSQNQIAKGICATVLLVVWYGCKVVCGCSCYYSHNVVLCPQCC